MADQCLRRRHRRGQRQLRAVTKMNIMAVLLRTSLPPGGPRPRGSSATGKRAASKREGAPMSPNRASYTHGSKRREPSDASLGSLMWDTSGASSSSTAHHAQSSHTTSSFDAIAGNESWGGDGGAWWSGGDTSYGGSTRGFGAGTWRAAARGRRNRCGVTRASKPTELTDPSINVRPLPRPRGLHRRRVRA
jgi:hypothetical protein